MGTMMLIKRLRSGRGARAPRGRAHEHVQQVRSRAFSVQWVLVRVFRLATDCRPGPRSGRRTHGGRREETGPRRADGPDGRARRPAPAPRRRADARARASREARSLTL